MMIQSAAAIIFNEEGQILVVSRKDNPNDFGLPGGKVDPGETLDQTIVREVREETGLKVISAQPIFTLICNKIYMSLTFFIKEWEGEVGSEEKGVLKWVDFEYICKPENSCFWDYNKELYEYLVKNEFIEKG